MARNRKTVRKGFGHLRCDDFADYLSKMAREGWHFKEWGLGLVFERGEPEEAVYAVELFTDATDYDTRPEPKTREFAEYCEAAGWKLVDAKGKLCIFKRVRPDAVEILTPEERLENISREERKTVWRAIVLPGVYTATRLAEFFGYQFTATVFSNWRMMITAVWIVLLLAAVTRCVQFYLWRYSARKKLARGEAVRFSRTGNGLLGSAGWYEHLTSWVLVGMIAAICVLGQYSALWVLAGMLVPTLLLSVLLSKFRPESGTNELIQIVFNLMLPIVVVAFLLIGVAVGAFDVEEEDPVSEPPLLYEDIGGTWELQGSKVMYNASILGSYLHCFPDYEEGYFYYSVYKSGQDWILDRIWADNIGQKRNEDRTDCTAQWGAETAFQNTQGDYYVRYGDAILILEGEEVTALTAEQIDIIREKLELR